MIFLFIYLFIKVIQAPALKNPKLIVPQRNSHGCPEEYFCLEFLSNYRETTEFQRYYRRYFGMK